MEYGSEFHARANDPFERALPGFVQEDWSLVRSGRDALKALAGLVRGRRVLLPALCCESMLVPFTQSGCELVFYRLREDLRGDEADVRDKLRDGALLLYMSYFGIHPFPDAFLREPAGRRKESAAGGGPDPGSDRAAPGGRLPAGRHGGQPAQVGGAAGGRGAPHRAAGGDRPCRQPLRRPAAGGDGEEEPLSGERRPGAQAGRSAAAAGRRRCWTRAASLSP